MPSKDEKEIENEEEKENEKENEDKNEDENKNIDIIKDVDYFVHEYSKKWASDFNWREVVKNYEALVIKKKSFFSCVLDQWLKGGRCDILTELMSIGFSRPKCDVHFANHG